MAPSLSIALALLACCCRCLPSPPLYFPQLVDHFSVTTPGPPPTFLQRYYANDTSFKGPGYPIICIMGGEEALPPSKGILYPSLVVLAGRLGAAIVEPEHRYFGESLPFPGPYSASHLSLLTPQQALADSAAFIEAMRVQRGCTGRGGQPRCPVITAGGSYPGWQAAMMRVRFPAVVDMAYSASPAMGFYTGQVDPLGYYRVVTESAARASPTCPAAVRALLAHTLATGDKGAMVARLNLCQPLPAYLEEGNGELLKLELAMVFQYTWADLNMGNYPPTNATRLAQACASIEAGAYQDPWGTLAAFFGGFSSALGGAGSSSSSSSPSGCFNVSAQMPSGPNATISAGDWSGVGRGDDGTSWDFQTCSLLTTPIGTNNVSDMFFPRAWDWAWLQAHCGSRFGIAPQPRTLPDLWGFDLEALPRVTSRIVFTNGLNDGWSVGGVKQNLSSTLLAFNMPNGAHHSDLNYAWPNASTDTEDVSAVRSLVAGVLEGWLAELRG